MSLTCAAFASPRSQLLADSDNVPKSKDDISASSIMEMINSSRVKPSWRRMFIGGPSPVSLVWCPPCGAARRFPEGGERFGAALQRSWRHRFEFSGGDSHCRQCNRALVAGNARPGHRDREPPEAHRHGRCSAIHVDGNARWRVGFDLRGPGVEAIVGRALLRAFAQRRLDAELGKPALGA